VAALLLVGWLGSRLGWQMSRLRPAAGGGLAGSARSGSARGAGPSRTGSSTGSSSTDGDREIAIHLEPAPEQEVRGLESVAIATASGRRVGLRRGAGGLRSRRRDPDGHEREWTILGASRGESGILGEGIRQSLLRDPTYGPALAAAETMTP
jgi:hypothetical protein